MTVRKWACPLAAFLLLSAGAARPQGLGSLAPELRGSGWLNAPPSFSLFALKGRLVLLDFWTDSQPDCVREIAQLEKLEAQHPGLVVVGVHTPELPEQAPLEALREAVLRDEVSYPVLDDAARAAWSAYGVKDWLTRVLIGPDGRVVARFQGLGRLDDIEKALERAGAASTAVTKPLDFPLERDAEPSRPLAFPGKVMVDQARRRLFVSDSGHHRVVVADLSGRVLKVIGSGEESVIDGPIKEAGFSRPQGTALVGRDLYVADEGNDRVRQVDLKDGLVRTMRETFQMDAPRDLAFADDRLFIAAAGFDYVMMLNTHRGLLSSYAGGGRPGLSDGSLDNALLSQPSGLAYGDGALFVVDAGSGAVRAIDLSHPAVRTAATGLRHPLGLAFARGALYVTDTFRGRIARVDPKSGKMETIADGFDEPAGLAAFDGGLLVADTGRHRLVKLSLDGKSRSVFTLRGLKAPPPAPPTFPMPAPKKLVLPPARVRAGKKARLLLNVKLPPGYRLHPLAPLYYAVMEAAGPIKFEPKTRRGLLRRPSLPVAIDFQLPAGKGEAVVNAAFYYCREDGKGLCKAKAVILDQPITASASEKASSITLSVTAD